MPHPNDPALRSFVEVDPVSDFPIQNLPYGVFSSRDGLAPRVGVAIGNFVLDLWELEQDGRLDVGELGVFAASMLNPFMALGPNAWSRTRARISELLRHDNPELRDNAELRGRALVPMADVKLHLPIAVAGYTDFYSSKEHATNVGVMFRGKDNALQPNWLHMPIGYNGRASTVVVSGTAVRRPRGQLKPPNVDLPSFGAVQAARFRARNGRRDRTIVGDRRDAERAAGGEMIFGLCCSTTGARAISSSGNMCRSGRSRPRRLPTSISPWIVTREALEPFRLHGPARIRRRCLICGRRSQTITILNSRSACARRPWTTAAHLPHQFQIHVLVVGAAIGAPRLHRLRHECRRSPRQRHHQRAGEGSARQPVGNQLERRRADRTCRAASGGHFSRTAIRWSCAAGARATVIASASAKSRARSCRRRNWRRGLPSSSKAKRPPSPFRDAPLGQARNP